MKFKIFLTTIMLFIITSVSANDLVSKSSPDVKLYIISPVNSDVVSGTFIVRFGLSGMGVAPAGANIDNTGHHHLLIDLDELPNLTQPLASTDNIKHFGKGQTQTELTLSLGMHTLQLVLGNYLHIPHDKPVISEKITITVE